MVVKLKIKSKENPDWSGTWEKDYVEQDMIDELNYCPTGNEWIAHVLKENIDDGFIDGDIEELIVENDSVRRIDLVVGDYDISFEKTFEEEW